MTRSAVLLAVLLTVASVGGVVTAVPDARLTVSGVTVTPTNPLVGEQFTVEATVASSAGSTEAVRVASVQLRHDGRTLSRADNPGSLSPGDSLTVPVTGRFDGPGTRTLELLVIGFDASGDRVTISRPVPIAVERAAPQVELAVTEPAVDTETRVQVTVSNPSRTAMRNLVVTVNESTGRTVVGRQVVPRLAAGATTTVTLTTVPAEAGRQRLSVDVAYTTDSGTEAVTTHARRVRVAPFVEDVGVEIAPAPEADAQQVPAGGLGGILGGAGGGNTVRQAGSEDGERDRARYEVEVTNFGTTTLSNVVVRPETGNGSLPRQRLNGTLGPGESGTVVVDLTALRSETEIDVVVRYDAGVRRGSTTEPFTFRPRTGDVRLTDLNLTLGDDGRVTVSGNAANVGRGTVDGLVVSVVQSGEVRPAYPQRDYFVGTVEGSDFAPFELTARVDGSAEAVPVRIAYRADGISYSRVVEVPVVRETDRTRGLGLPVGGAGAVAVGLALVLGLPAVAYAVRAGRGRR